MGVTRVWESHGKIRRRGLGIASSWECRGKAVGAGGLGYERGIQGNKAEKSEPKVPIQKKARFFKKLFQKGEKK